MKKSRWIAMMAAANLFVLSLAATAYSADIEIIGTDESEVQTEAPAIAVQPEASLQAQDAVSAVSSENGAADAASSGQETEADGTQPDQAVPSEGILNPEKEHITAEEAVSGARTLYSQMQHYADVNDNSSFAALFEPGADVQTVQDQLQIVKSSLRETKNLNLHTDLCFFDPTKNSTKSPYYFAVALCDYEVDGDGAVTWYSTLIRLAKYEDGWKASISPAADLLETNYPEAFREARADGRNAVDLYPSLGMRFASGAVFDGTLYALPNLLWQDPDGSVQCALWLANGTSTSKWCDSMDLIVTDSAAGDVVKVSVPVQKALEGGESAMVICTIPSWYVSSGTTEWTQVSVNSNLKYQ